MISNDVIRARCTTDFKIMAGRAAAMDKKNLSEYLLSLIEQDCKKKGVFPIMNKDIYYINFNTGAGNEEASSLNEAMEIAVKGATYTQQPITIINDGNEVARLPWYGIAPGEDDTVTVRFGDFGFYGEWEING